MKTVKVIQVGEAPFEITLEAEASVQDALNALSDARGSDKVDGFKPRIDGKTVEMGDSFEDGDLIMLVLKAKGGK